MFASNNQSYRVPRVGDYRKVSAGHANVPIILHLFPRIIRDSRSIGNDQLMSPRRATGRSRPRARIIVITNKRKCRNAVSEHCLKHCANLAQEPVPSIRCPVEFPLARTYRKQPSKTTALYDEYLLIPSANWISAAKFAFHVHLSEVSSLWSKQEIADACRYSSTAPLRKLCGLEQP